MHERTVRSLRSRPSKGDSGYSKAILGAIIIYAAARYIIPFAALGPLPVLATSATAQAPAVIPSRVIRVVEFEDRGRTYRVDLESGRVTFTGEDDKPTPEPPRPEPPRPEPPKLDSLALLVHDQFRSKVTTNIVETAAGLAQAIEVTLAVSGGLGLKGQQILDELSKQIDYAKLQPRLRGFPLGDILKDAVKGDPDKIAPSLREAMIGLRAVR